MQEINHEYYVSLEVAKLLKDAGFDWEVCDGYIIYEDDHVFTTNFQTTYNFNGDNKDLFSSYRGHKEVFSKPTLDVAQRWLREVKGYYVAWEFNMNINSWGQELYDFTDISVYIFVDSDQGNICKCKLKENYKTIEEAQEAGIKKTLEIILEEGE